MYKRQVCHFNIIRLNLRCGALAHRHERLNAVVDIVACSGKYIEFVNRDENIDFDTKMKTLQSELRDLLVAEEKSKADLLTVFKELGYEIEL